MEELQARHRKEQRDLQSRITQKKKQAGKKTRKGVNDECDRLEAELREKQAQEVAALEGGGGGGGGEVDGEALPIEQMEDLALTMVDACDDARPKNARDGDGQEQAAPIAPEEPEQNGSAQPGKKRNRQKDRLARRAAEQEEAARQAEEEAQDMPDLRQQERTRMLEAMRAHRLHEKEIRADGHCLYSAVADQLGQLDIPLGAMPDDKQPFAYQTVRAKAAEYIHQHQDDFVPFLEEPLPDYLHKVRDTGEWGGQLELMALARTYGIDINVLQDFGRVEKIPSGGDETTDKAMWLGYYKHGFGLGEHYNSLRKGP